MSLFGCLGYELDLTELLPVEQAEIRAQTEFYRAHRRTLQYGRFTRGRTDGGGTVWQMQTKGRRPSRPSSTACSPPPRLRAPVRDGAGRENAVSPDLRPQLLRVGDFGRSCAMCCP